MPARNCTKKIVGTDMAHTLNCARNEGIYMHKFQRSMKSDQVRKMRNIISRKQYTRMRDIGGGCTWGWWGDMG